MGLILAHLGVDHLGISPVVILVGAIAFMGISLAIALRQPVEKDGTDADERSESEKVAGTHESRR